MGSEREKINAVLYKLYLSEKSIGFSVLAKVEGRGCFLVLENAL
jgi:hypothetical protein